jgi:hypothetical protein
MYIQTFFIFCCALFTASCSSNLEELSGDWLAEDLSAVDLSCSEDLEGDYVLSLDAESSSYSLELDINGCGGSIVDGRDGKIEFESPACTEACCDSEGALCLRDALLVVDSYELTSSQLILEGSDVRIVFSPVD